MHRSLPSLGHYNDPSQGRTMAHPTPSATRPDHASIDGNELLEPSALSSMLDDMEVQIGANERRASSPTLVSLQPRALQGLFVPASVNPTPAHVSLLPLYAFASVLNDLPCITTALSGSYLIYPCLSLAHRLRLLKSAFGGADGEISSLREPSTTSSPSPPTARPGALPPVPPSRSRMHRFPPPPHNVQHCRALGRLR
ncbi:hypothetical protein D9611_008305 [Ephemerocybe angulata]|uniref:Uncharacterized protein n=1 Tax=Ephemerocybe angulata TaxID=980116 RepID=A0A8H5BIJ0_9AGAR|nr:hypothetical protein D9611_008305 [Tulosesus angulatus]